MEAIRQAFLKSLELQPTGLLASVWIINRIPVIFNNDMESYATWRHDLADDLKVDPSAVLITGSASFGISLNPYKNYRAFDSNSDVDIAVVSDYHFTEGWRALRNLGSGIHRLNPPMKQAVQDHVNRLIYWGTIATDRILPILPYGQKWQDALECASKRTPTIDRTLNIRVYRDLDSLRAYQVNNLNTLKAEHLSRDVK